MRVRALFILFLLCCSCFVDAQRYSLAEQKRFAYYLYSQRLYDDFLLQSAQIRTRYTLSTVEQDSLFYCQASCLAFKGQHENAAGFYTQVSGTTSLGLRSRFLAAEHYCRGGNVQYARNTMNGITADTSLVRLNDFYLASFYLFGNNVKAFREFSAAHKAEAGFFGVRWNELNAYAQRMKKAENKSMFLAGLMSAVVPGTGKIYAGKWRQGIVSIFPLAIMGLQTWEGFAKGGIKSPRFIVFGSLFSLFYIGNIWGSALSVSVRKQEIRNEVHNEMLVNLHLALEHVLGKGN
jgi:hypothetical protein